MKTPYFIGIALLLVSFSASAQIDPSAALSIDTTDKGFLPPRLTTIQRDAITNPATALQIYNLDNAQLEVWNGTAWVTLAGNSSAIADTDGDTQIQTEENSDEDILRFDTAGTERMVIDNAGNVGIGTRNPNADLEVNGIIMTDTLMRDTNNRKYIFIPESTNDLDFESVAQLRVGTYMTLGNFGATNNSFRGVNAILDYSSTDGSGTEGIGNKFIPHYSPGKGFVTSESYDGRITSYGIDWSSSSARKTFPDDFTNIMTQLYNGNVGIGTTAPTGKLTVRRSGKAGHWDAGTTSSLNRRDSNIVSILEGSTGCDGCVSAAIGAEAKMTANNGNNFYNVGLYATASGGPKNYAAILEEGNVGIGTREPNAKLHVNGNLKLEGDDVFMGYINSTGLDSPFLRLESGSDSSGAGVAIGAAGLTVIGGGESATTYFNAIANKGDEDMVIASDDGIRFVTRMQNGYAVRREAMYITSNGDVGIGTTAPTHKLSVNGSAGKSGGGSWSTFSDRRIKKDISPYTKGLAEIIQINPVNFTYTDQGPFTQTGESQVGIIAQEIQEILPSTVSETKTEIFDDLLQFNGSELTFTLINAVKELQAENEEMKALQMKKDLEVRALQAENAAILKRLEALENR